MGFFIYFTESMLLFYQLALHITTQLDNLQRQLGSGQKADNYAGLGLQSGIAVSLNAQLAALGSFDTTMTNVGNRQSICSSRFSNRSEASAARCRRQWRHPASVSIIRADFHPANGRQSARSNCGPA